MALSTTNDYALAVNRILYYLDDVFGGIDWYRMPIYSQMLPEDAATLRAAYATYKQTRDARPSSTELAPGSHGDNVTTSLSG